MIFIGRFLAGFGTGYVLKHVVYNYIYRNEAFGYPCQNTTMEERESQQEQNDANFSFLAPSREE